MRPERLLPWLLGGAVGAAGILQGLQWRHSTAREPGDDDPEGRIAALESEVALLKRENESLRSLAQGGGEFSVPQEMIAFAETSVGLNFKSTPQVHQIATEELRDRVAAAIEARYGPHGLDSRQQAWILMGHLSPDDRFAGQLAAMKALGARSWFDDRVGEAWVTQRYDPASIPDQAALIRALVRILIHQHYPPPAGWSGDEIETAREALHQGTALAVENRFLTRQALGIGFVGTQDDGQARELLANLPAFVRGIATFPSVLGLPRAERLFDQEEILGALHSPPLTTADYFPDQEELKPVPPILPETPGNPLLDETAGMLGLRLWLEPLGEEFPPLATAWRGDRYRLYATGENALHLIWDIRLASEKDADALAAAAARLLAGLAQRDDPPGPGETLVSPEGRRLKLERPAPDIVRFLNTANAP